MLEVSAAAVGALRMLRAENGFEIQEARLGVSGSAIHRVLASGIN